MEPKAELKKYLQDCINAAAKRCLQYKIDEANLGFAGYGKLEDKIHVFSHENRHMIHHFSTRLLELGGDPVIAADKTVPYGSFPDFLTRATAMEKEAIKMLEDGVETATKANDSESAHLFRKKVSVSWDHLNWLNKQKALIKDLGMQDYAAQKL